MRASRERGDWRADLLVLVLWGILRLGGILLWRGELLAVWLLEQRGRVDLDGVLGIGRRGRNHRRCGCGGDGGGRCCCQSRRDQHGDGYILVDDDGRGPDGSLANDGRGRLDFGRDEDQLGGGGRRCGRDDDGNTWNEDRCREEDRCWRGDDDCLSDQDRCWHDLEDRREGERDRLEDGLWSWGRRTRRLWTSKARQTMGDVYFSD